MQPFGMRNAYWAVLSLSFIFLFPRYLLIDTTLRNLQSLDTPKQELPPRGGKRAILSSPHLPPDQVFLEWKQAHSVDALRSNPHNRTFMIADYSCPREAGNKFHDFTSAMLQAIATNRTVLWRYRLYNRWKRVGENSMEECERILDRAAWIPSYDEWSKELNLSQPYEMPRYTDFPEIVEDVSSNQVIVPGILRGVERKFDVWQGLLFMEKNGTATYLSQTYNINIFEDERIPKLYSQGIAYLYGMLFWESFSMTKDFLATVRNELDTSKPYVRQLGEAPKETYTIGLHSRHASHDNAGYDVHKEIQCLDWLISKRQNDTVPCAVFIMSDRPATIQNITNYLRRTTNCDAISVSSDPSSQRNLSEIGEHGPFAGAGFFRDLAVASQARSAFTGSPRSSSALLLEFIEYKRRNEAWRDDHKLLDPLLRC